MDGAIKFDYYYGIEAEQFSFYRVPRLLIKDARFKELSSDAKLLYGLMLDRLALSIKNGWLDEENRVYIHYTLDTDLSYTNPINQSDSGTEKQKTGKPDNAMIDVMDEASAYMEIIKKNIEYEHHMKYGDWSEKGLYEELYEVMCEIVCVKRKTVKVNGEDYPYELVKSKFLKLDSSHLEYVIGCMKETTTRITNIRAYMVTALYNAPNTINHYYQQLVQHDMYGGGWEEKGMFERKAEGDG